ncbi:MAG: FAD-dependent oxidoreductase [Candidatus Omnitrophica bacterium]|nr:FAD-dependent oxidoreductase [Candidatus Omnitrophota bacterium]
MSKLVIIGASPVSIQLIKQLRDKNFSGDITLMLFDGFLPYTREVLSTQTNLDQAQWPLIQPKEFFDSLKVNVLFDREISRINTSRKKIFTENKDQLDYDWLVIAETPKNRFPDIKGVNKEGVFGARKKKDVATVIEKFSFAENIIISSDDFSGFDLACYFAQKRSDVVLVQSSHGFFTEMFSAEILEWLQARLREKRITLEIANVVQEVLGDMEVKAVRLASGKVYAGEVVIFDGLAEDLRLFYDSAIEMKDQVVVNEFFQTTESSIFALDEVGLVRGSKKNHHGVSNEYLAHQANVAAEHILAREQGQEVAGNITYSSPFSKHIFKLGDFEFSFLGDCVHAPNIEVSEILDKEQNQYRKSFMSNGILVGAILINYQKDLDKYLNSIGKEVNVIFEKAS